MRSRQGLSPEQPAALSAPSTVPDPGPPAATPNSQRIAAFDRAITSQRIAEDRYIKEINHDWDIVRGPNGGYLAALMLQAMTSRVAQPSRRPRVLSINYPSAPKPGPAEIRTRLERSGRTTSWVSAELIQADRLCVAARAALSEDWPSIEYTALSMPSVPASEYTLSDSDGLPPFTKHFHYRSLYATPMSAGRGAHDAVGGFIRLRDPRPYDAPLLAVLSDAWFPSSYAFDPRVPMAATLDLTVYFRNYAELSRLDAEAFMLTVFRSRLAAEGFFEEDGELWSPEGILVAQSRQLAVAAPVAG